MLREEFRSGRLKAAPKKAEVLQNLCDRLGYDSEAALDVHKSIFTERIETFLVKQHLTGASATPVAARMCLLAQFARVFPRPPASWARP